ncbi:hypothetical protein [Desulfosporosinus sp. OT]|uniref:hypothetical protein n=1 Tax=Desulfosporosinus sp. OT TaxID=913865 RepID=UPI000223B07B|nr:hypothetical protein [Desulfosporosinus sp. OT]EGW39561.1 hypothetical protein DOT_2282 [Desulfosporosinus sp. OT]
MKIEVKRPCLEERSEVTAMRIALITKPIVESETPEPLIFKSFKQDPVLYAETRDIGVVPYQVTYAAFNKVKFYLDFSTVADPEIVSNLENVAEFTISKIKASLHIPKEIIKDVTYDINKVDWVVYFEIILSPCLAQTSFIELLSYFTNECL